MSFDHDPFGPSGSKINEARLNEQIRAETRIFGKPMSTYSASQLHAAKNCDPMGMHNVNPYDGCNVGTGNSSGQNGQSSASYGTRGTIKFRAGACLTAAVGLGLLFVVQPIGSYLYSIAHQPKDITPMKSTDQRLADSGVIAVKKMAADLVLTQAGKVTLSEMKKAADKFTNAQFKGPAEQLMSYKENEKGFYKIYEDKFKVSTTVPAPNGVATMAFDRKATIHFSAELLTTEQTESAVKKANLTGTNPIGFKLNADVVFYSTTASVKDENAPQPVIFEPDPKKNEDGRRAYSDYYNDMFSESHTVIYFGPSGTEKVILNAKGEVVKPTAPSVEKKPAPTKPEPGKSNGKPSIKGTTAAITKTFG